MCIRDRYRILRKDGGTSWIYLRAKRVGEWEGYPLFQGVFIDITQQKNIIRALEMEQQRYNVVTEITEEILFEQDIATDTPVSYPHLTQHFPQIRNACRQPRGTGLHEFLPRSVAVPVSYTHLPMTHLLSNGGDFNNVRATLFNSNFPKDAFDKLEAQLRAEGLLGQNQDLTYGNAASILSQVALGTLTVNPDGSYSFTLPPDGSAGSMIVNMFGADNFSNRTINFSVTDPHGGVFKMCIRDRQYP